MGRENDEPLTPAGRFLTQPAIDQVINGAVGLQRSIELDEARTFVSDSLLIKHPRFCSLLVTDHHGRPYWRKTEVDIDRHIILRSDPVSEADNNESATNDYLADLTVSSPLSTDKPLWEMHLLSAHKSVVFRFHHALGDGVSLMSLLLTSGRKLDDPEKRPTIEPLVSSSGRNPRRRLGIGRKLLRGVKVIWFTMIYVFEFVMRSLWVKDGKTVLRGGEGVELWPRKLVTVKFNLDDMKTVKNAVSNATINDVLLGVISSGLSKYLDKRSSESLQEGLRITGVTLVNLRPSPGLQDIKELMKQNAGLGWGNKSGIMLLPIYYHRNSFNPLDYLKRAKMMIDKKKLSLEAFMSYQIVHFLMNLVGEKFASFLFYRILCNTSFTVSNVVGPREEITMADIPVNYIRPTLSSLSHAISMLMMSYAGKADLQILVAKDIIHDPENLAKCFEDALVEMKESVLRT